MYTDPFQEIHYARPLRPPSRVSAGHHPAAAGFAILEGNAIDAACAASIALSGPT
jgi:hypothetical protein